MTIEKRLERIEAILDARGLDWDHPRVEEEPAKELEPEHPAGPMPDPGEGYRILSKDPPEDLAEGDDFWFSSYSEWHKSFHATLGITSQCDRLWFRRKIEPPKPAWGPKVGDWVKVTRPGDWTEWEHPNWEGAMNQFDEKIGKIECEWGDCFQICGFAAPNGFRYQFHRDWLSPAEPPEPPQPEYREPVLPADAGKVCEFSINGNDWTEARLRGYAGHLWQSVSSEEVGAKVWTFARINKDA